MVGLLLLLLELELLLLLLPDLKPPPDDLPPLGIC
jgi:hypothetical protein